MKILVPRMSYLPSGRRLAVVLAEPTSLPACGSVKHIVPAHLPLNMLGTYVASCSGVPNVTITSAAPWVSDGYMLNERVAPHMNSSTIIASVNGPAGPPWISSTASVRQPASNSAFHASLKPAGTWTWPSMSLQPSSSPERLNGPRYFWTQAYDSSSTVLTSS